MKYTLLTGRNFERAFKKLPQAIQKRLETDVLTLETTPYQGELLKGKFRFLRSFHLKYNNVDYRMIYSVNEQKHEIMLFYVASRENFYKQIERLHLKTRL